MKQWPCNFDCRYCEVNRALPGREEKLDTEVRPAPKDRTCPRSAGCQQGPKEMPSYSSLHLLFLRSQSHSARNGPSSTPLDGKRSLRFGQSTPRLAAQVKLC